LKNLSTGPARLGRVILSKAKDLIIVEKLDSSSASGAIQNDSKTGFFNRLKLFSIDIKTLAYGLTNPRLSASGGLGDDYISWKIN